MRLRRWLFIFYVCTAIHISYAQKRGQLVEKSLDLKIPFAITQYSTKDDLPQNQVLDIIPKANGSLIIATAMGIVEYNGSEFKSFIKNTQYKNHIYYKLFWHERTKQLFGKDTDGRPYLLYPYYTPIGNYSVFNIANDSIYCIDVKGNIYSSPIEKITLKKIAATNVKGAFSMFYSSGQYLIGNQEGTHLYYVPTNQTKMISKNRSRFFERNPYNKVIYSIGPKKISKIQDTLLKVVFDLSEFDPEAFCHSISFTDKHDFFLATSRGLIEAREGETDYYTKKSALPSAYLHGMYYNANENCLFIGTLERGLLKLQQKNCSSFSAPQGFSETSSLCSILKTSTGKLLILSTQGDIYRMAIDTVYNYAKLNASFSSLAEIDGVLCAGTWRKGLLLIKDSKSFDTLKFPYNLPDKSVHACFKDSKGNIWIGTGNGIAKGSSFDSIVPFLTKSIKNTIICFYELKNGNICIGGHDGVYVLDKNHTLSTYISKKENLTGREVRCFYEDEEGKLWIGTYGGGLYCYYKNSLTSINKRKNCKIDKDVFCIAKDDFGYLYMTSNSGLFRIKEKDLSDFYYNKLQYLIPFHYDQEAGILNTEFNGGFQNNYLKTTNNHFYFPTIQGLVVTLPEKPRFRKLYTAISTLIVNDTLHNLNNNILNRNTFSIEFSFSCTSFLNKYNVHYQYKLQKEKESEWSAPQKSNFVSFKMLPPGKYKFSVRALDAFNDPHPTISSYAFEIKPYYHESFWFRAIAILVLTPITLLFAGYRVKQFKKKTEEKERVKRQIAELELSAIQSQMNPHFIFNSLNSIKYYLSVDDKNNADIYIDHFSKLLRDFLETGSKSFISLNKEIQILNSYLELEKQRMNPSFDFKISCEPALKNVLIPTHLIQPFAENAIKHGINHSLRKCKLIVSFIKQNNDLVCLIDDDGIGRKKAGEINKNKSTHSSKGIEMVLEKIRIVKEIYGIEIEFSIDDKLDTNQNSIGTRVKLIIPITQNENDNN